MSPSWRYDEVLLVLHDSSPTHISEILWGAQFLPHFRYPKFSILPTTSAYLRSLFRLQREEGPPQSNSSHSQILF